MSKGPIAAIWLNLGHPRTDVLLAAGLFGLPAGSKAAAILRAGMTSTLKWIRPTRANVMALWSRIKDGCFKTSAGIPRFQVARDPDDADGIILSWSYDRNEVVRCSIDDIPAYLPSVPFADVERVLRRIARRSLRPADPNITATQIAGEAVTRITQEAEQLFRDRISQVCADEEMGLVFMDVVRETLEEMVERKMIKGS